MSESERVEIPTIWVGLDEVEITLANQFVGQTANGQVILALGQTAPPLTSGTPEEQFEQLQGVPFLPVHPVSRVVMSKASLDELRSILDRVAQAYENQNQGGSRG